MPKPPKTDDKATIARLKRALAECQGKLSRKGTAGRKPTGRPTLTNAERSRRYRENQKLKIEARIEAARRGEE